MLGCAIPLVSGEAIPGIGAIERLHHAVALGLGDDRSGGDGEVDAVALVERILRDFDAVHGTCIHQHVLRAPRQRLDGAPHRKQRSMIDIETVDLLDRGGTHGKTRRLGAYFLGERRPRLGVEPFGIVHSGDAGFRREHHCGSHHRAGKRAHAHFIDARDVANAGLP